MEARIDSVITALTAAGHHENATIVSSIKETFLFEGWNQFFNDFVPKTVEHVFPVTLGHNDVLDGNILMNLHDNQKLMLIDYEFTMWSPMGYDLGKYLNEVMMDHRNPNGTGIVCYVNNILSYAEVAQVSRVYLSRYYERHMSPKAR